MKQKIQGLIVGLLIGAMLTGGTVFASQAIETISVMYDNIKILIDGVEYVAKDANGNVVEPFIYNGTTYLPVRGIANAFDKKVEWDAPNRTVKLGSVNYEWLDQMGYSDYYASTPGSSYIPWAKGWQDTQGNKYERGLYIKFAMDSCKDRDDGKGLTIKSQYLLNKKFKTVEGKIACGASSYFSDNEIPMIIKFYGDNKLLYTSPPIATGTVAIDVKIDISNVDVFEIVATISNPDIRNGTTQAGLIDFRLIK